MAFYFSYSFLYEETDRHGSLGSKRQQKEWRHGYICRLLTCDLTRVVLAGLPNLGVGSVMTLQKSCRPLLNSRRFDLISQTQTNSIHHCQNTTHTMHSGQSLAILALAFAFCNISVLERFITSFHLLLWEIFFLFTLGIFSRSAIY